MATKGRRARNKIKGDKKEIGKEREENVRNN